MLLCAELLCAELLCAELLCGDLCVIPRLNFKQYFLISVSYQKIEIFQGSSRISATDVLTAVYRGKSVPQKIRDVADPFTVHRYNPCKSCKIRENPLPYRENLRFFS